MRVEVGERETERGKEREGEGRGRGERERGEGRGDRGEGREESSADRIEKCLEPDFRENGLGPAIVQTPYNQRYKKAANPKPNSLNPKF